MPKKEEVQKKKPRGVSKAMVAQSENKVSEVYGKLAEFTRDVCRMEPVDRDDIPALEQRFADYLGLCSKHNVQVTNQGAYFAMGLTKDDAYNWEHGRTKGAEHSDFIKRVKSLCAFYRESAMAEGELDKIVGIFWQKNYDGMKDVQDVVVTPNNPMGDLTDKEQLAEKYRDSVVAEYNAEGERID